jgi:hypothetical protein
LIDFMAGLPGDSFAFMQGVAAVDLQLIGGSASVLASPVLVGSRTGRETNCQ